MKIAGRDGQKKQMAERILHKDGNGNFTIGSRGSTHKKNHVGRRADMVFLMGAIGRGPGETGRECGWCPLASREIGPPRSGGQAPPQAVRISLLAVSVEFASKYSGGISCKTKRHVAGVQGVKADAGLPHEGVAGRGNVLSGHANACDSA